MILALLLLGTAFSASIDTVRERFILDLVPTTASAGDSLADEVSEVLGHFLWSNCTFDDIPYSNRRPADWPVMGHLGRVQMMSEATNEKSSCSLRGNATVIAVAKCALDWWLINKPVNSNWYDQEIAAPNTIGAAVLLLPPLPSNSTAEALKLIEEADWKGWTGSNLLFMLRAQIFRGLIVNDTSLLEQAFQVGFAALAPFSQGDDGPQHDHSFHQHGPQLLSGSYGAEFSNHELEFAYLSAGTEWAPAGQVLENLAGMVLDGQQHMVRGSSWDWQVVGRGITVEPGSTAGVSGALVPAWMRALDYTPRGAEWEAFADRLEGLSNATQLVSSRGYWDSDYVAHSRAEWMVTLHMRSKRTIGAACVNEQGKLDRRLGDGATAVYYYGSEYDGVFPVWDFMRPPGVTGALNGYKLGCDNAKESTDAEFVGSASDGLYTVAAMNLQSEDDHLTANRAWFFLDNVFIAMGANISSESPVGTTLEQMPIDHPRDKRVFTQSSPSYPLPLPTSINSTDAWIWTSDTGFVPFLPGQVPYGSKPVAFQLFAGDRTGSWYDIGVDTGNTTRTILDMALLHEQTSSGAYAYAVFPKSSIQSMSESAKSLNGIQTAVSPTNDKMAVFDPNAKVLQAIFWPTTNSPPTPISPPNSPAGWSLSASIPSLAILRELSNGSVTLTASSPTSDSTLTMTVDRSLNCTACKPASKGTEITFNLPGGDYLGAPTTILAN